MAAALAGLLVVGCSIDPSVVTLSAEPADGDAVPGAAPPTEVGTDDPAAPTSEPEPPASPPTAVPPTTVPPATPPTTVPPTTVPPPTVPPPTVPPTTVPPTTVPPLVEPLILSDVALETVADLGGDKPVRTHDRLAAAALADIDRWWSEVFPDVYGEPFVPLQGAVYVGYPERATDIPGCAEPRTEYEDLQLFVAFYCQVGDFIAYDDGPDAPSILTGLADSFGPAVIGVVLAHEYAHAVQERIGALDRRLATIVTEQQADCFAGAWTGQAYRGDSPVLRFGDLDVRAGLLAMIEVRDPVGTNQFEAGGHGSAFDRVGAFQVGFDEGPSRCAGLLDEPLPLMPNEFQTLGDLERGGNASYDCADDPNPDCEPAPSFLAEDLDHFWRTTLGERFDPVTPVPVDDLATACDDAVVLTIHVVVCPTARTVVFDEPVVRDLYEEGFGDFSIGYVYGIGWAEFAQRSLGSALTGEQRLLLSDCYTGAWMRDITPDPTGRTPRGGVDRDGDGTPDGVTTSPGDLDEAIQMAILVGDEGARVDVVGSAFEKIGAFRVGVLGGLGACAAVAS